MSTLISCSFKIMRCDWFYPQVGMLAVAVAVSAFAKRLAVAVIYRIYNPQKGVYISIDIYPFADMRLGMS